MSLLLFMLPVMLFVGCVLLAMLLWAVRSGQFEDLEGEKHRIFFDDPGYGDRPTRPAGVHRT
jgi:cbb3-type cytochrome oxidase maturation protein